MAFWTCHALNLQQHGSGPRTLVMSHGFGADQRVWQPYVDELSRHFRVVTFDLACAASADPAFFNAVRHCEIDGYVADLLALLDENGIERCSFVGHSVSGMIGLLASRKRPQQFERLVAIGSSACYLNFETYHGGFERADINQIFLAIASDFHAWASFYAPHVVDRPTDDLATRNFAASLAAMRPDIALVTAEMILLSDHRHRLQSIRVPTVILQTRSDPAVPIEAAQYLNQQISGSVLEIVDATGHMPHMTAIPAVADALRRHLHLADLAAVAP